MNPAPRGADFSLRGTSVPPLRGLLQLATSWLLIFLPIVMSHCALAADAVQAGTVRWRGQPVPGAVVTAVSGGRRVITTTDEQGRYRINGLEAGKWTVRVEMFGFDSIERTLDVTAAGAPIAWSLSLKVTAKPEHGEALSPRGKPSEDTSAILEAAHPDVPAPQPPGAVNSSESFIMTGSMRQGLQTADPDDAAKAGRPGGRIRGATGVTFRDSLFDASPYSLTGQFLPKPDYSRQSVNFNLGGPLGKRAWKWRPAFTLGYQQGLGQDPYYAVATVPTPLERAGDFSQSVAAAPVTVYDPLSGQPFAQDRIPASRLRPASSGLLAFFPLPNLPGRVQNYQFISRTAGHSASGRANFDFKLSGKDSLAFSQTYSRGSSQGLQIFGYRDALTNSGSSSTLSWTRTITPRLVLSTYIVYDRTNSQNTPSFASGPDVAAQLGIVGTSQDPVNYGPPNLTFTNYGAVSDSSFSLRRDSHGEVAATLYHSAGAHNLSYGVTYSHDWLNLRTDENGRGTYFFSGLATSAFDPAGNPIAGTGFDFADFLLGLPQSGSIRFGASGNGFRGGNSAGFVTEDWAVAPNLSVSLGLRYEYYSPYTETRNQMANLDVASDFTNVAVVLPRQPGPYSGAFPRSLINPDRNGFAPRVGFDWSPLKNRPFTVRAGYGIYYDGSVYEPLAERLASQPPFANTGNLTTSTALPLTIENGFLTAVPGSPDTILNTYAVARNYRPGSAQIWNLVLSQDLPGGIHLEEGYLGTKGTHLDIQRLPNRADPGSPLSSGQRRLIPYADAFIFDSSDGDSTLHAAQVHVARRLHRGILANLLYTYGKMIDDVSTYGGGLTVVAQNDLDLRAERGLSSQDVRQTLTSSFALISPFGNQGFLLPTGFFGALARGWILQGGFAYSSGHWLTARVLGNVADAAGSGSVGNARADATGLPIASAQDFFNLAAFSIPAAGQFGTAGRNTIPLPAALTVNASFSRTFRLDERRRLEFRAESNNLANAVNISGLGATVNASNYGVATSTALMRSLSLRIRFLF
jgi:hypothetical protein